MRTTYYKSNNYKKNERIRLFIIQRLMGLVMLIFSVILYVMCMDAPVGSDDGGGLLITIPLGLWMLFSKKLLIQ